MCCFDDTKPEEIGMKRIGLALALAGAVVLSGCVVAPPPRPGPAAHFIPGHYNPYGQWIPGHWV
jgi:hypothetical protein